MPALNATLASYNKQRFAGGAKHRLTALDFAGQLFRFAAALRAGDGGGVFVIDTIQCISEE
jgi:hypothetical protein